MQVHIFEIQSSKLKRYAEIGKMRWVRLNFHISNNSHLRPNKKSDSSLHVSNTWRDTIYLHVTSYNTFKRITLYSANIRFNRTTEKNVGYILATVNTWNRVLIALWTSESSKYNLKHYENGSGNWMPLKKPLKTLSLRQITYSWRPLLIIGLFIRLDVYYFE